MNNKIYNIGQNIVKYLGITFIFYLFIGSFINNIYDENWMEVFVKKYDLFYNLLAVVLFGIIYIVLLKLRNRFPLNEKKWRRIYISLIFLIFILIFVQFPTPNNDQANLYKAVYAMVVENDMSWLSDPYWIVWPHMIYMVVFLKIFTAIPYYFYIFNLILLVISFICIMKMTNTNKYIASAFVLCAPLIQYTCFYYGEICAIFAITLSIYLIDKIYKNKANKRDYLFLALITFFGYWAKNNFLIFITAECLSLLLFFIKDKKINLILSIFIILISTFSVKPILNTYIENAYGIQIRKTSNLSYVAMGMHPMGTPILSVQIEGGYDGSNGNVVYDAGYDIELADKYFVDDIKKSLSTFINDPLYALNFYNNKILKQWATPDFSVNHNVKLTEYANLYHLSNDMRNDGDDFDAISYDYQQFIHTEDKIQDIFSKGLTIITYGLSLFYLVYKKKELSFLETILYALFLGNFLFSIIWEAKPRYCIYGYYALLILAFTFGLPLLKEKIKEWKSRINKI